MTEQQIEDAARAGCQSVAELTMHTGCGTNCGSCLGLAEELLEQARSRHPLPLPVLRSAA